MPKKNNPTKNQRGAMAITLAKGTQPIYTLLDGDYADFLAWASTEKCPASQLAAVILSETMRDPALRARFSRVKGVVTS